MALPRRLTAFTAALLLIPFLAGSNCKKKGEDPSDDVMDMDGDAAQDIDVDLSLVAVTPSVVTAGVSSDVAIRGAGFATGLRVFVGSDPAEVLAVETSNLLRARVPAMAVGRYDLEVVGASGESSVLRQALTVQDEAPACASLTIYFDTARNGLRPDAENLLERHVDCLKRASAPIVIEGHADERGTTDYNLALGDRRANSVSRWLQVNGVSPSRIRTVSYGEERPVERGHDEVAWSANRRAEVLLGN